MRADRMQELGANFVLQRRRAGFDQPQTQVHVAEQLSLGRLRERGSGEELEGPPDVVFGARRPSGPLGAANSFYVPFDRELAIHSLGWWRKHQPAVLGATIYRCCKKLSGWFRKSRVRRTCSVFS